jgi:chromosome partitioning protein
MTKVISIVNQKGGVGKTTTALNLGLALAELGQHILLIDLDPQAHLSLGLGTHLDDGEKSIYHFLFDNSVDINAVIKRNIRPMVDLLPSDINLSASDLQLINEMNRERVLKRRIEKLKAPYDFVIIDNAPSLSLLTINSLTAGDYVLVPVQSAFWALKGMSQLFETIEKIKKADLNPTIEVLGILLTMFDQRTSISKQVLERLTETFGAKVFETTIKKTVQFDYAAVAQTPLLDHAPNSDVAVAYRSVAKEVMSRVQKS